MSRTEYNQEDSAVPTPDQAFDLYLAMWNAVDEERRRELADQALTENAEVLYPSCTV